MSRKISRRMAAILALGVALAPVTPAAAHTCSIPTQAEVGAPLAISFGVPAEQSAVVAVEISVPEGFRLDGADPAPAWTVERQGQRVRLAGGVVPPFGCAYFVLRGEATRRERLVFPFTVRTEDGTTMDYRGDKIGDPRGAQLVFAGVEPQPSDYLGADSGGLSLPWAVSALGGVGLVAVAGVVIYRRADTAAGAAPVRRRPETRRVGRRRGAVPNRKSAPPPQRGASPPSRGRSRRGSSAFPVRR